MNDRKQLGKGYWYNVYDLNNGRVFKIEKGFIQKVRDTYESENKNIFAWMKALFWLLTERKTILAGYSHIKDTVDVTLIGSPTFLDGISYEQEKVELLGAVILRSEFAEKKRLIDLYIRNIIQCWRNGFADNVYNFTINNGLDTSGRLILLDFNEITFSQEEVLKRINSKPWLRSWSFTQIDPELRQYYREQMDALITPESLLKNWSQEQKMA